MTTTAPPSSGQDLHVQAPIQAPAQASAPVQAPAAPSIPMEDRQLTPEETESLLRGVTPEPEQQQSNADDPEQAQMAQDFFSTGQAPAARQAAVLPQKPTAEQVQQMASMQVPVQQQQQPQAQPVPVGSEQIAALTAQNQLLQQSLASMQADMQRLSQGQQQQQPQQAQQQQQQQQPQPAQLNVPDQYLTALASEDANVRRVALNGLLNGAVQAAVDSVRQEFNPRLQGVPEMIQAQLQQYTRAVEINRDMYGTYPELAQHRQYVKSAAQQLAGNLGADAWSPDVRDAIAERIAPMVPGLMQRIQQNRAQRFSQSQVFQQPQGQQYMQLQQQPAQQQQFVQQQQIPQAPVGAYPPVPTGYSQPVGGVHGGPVYVRDNAGHLVPYQPQQQFVAGQQTRPGGQQVNPSVQDIWSTLGY